MEKQQKKLSLVVVGLPETDKLVTRSQADKTMLLDICDRAGVDKGDIVDVFRNGQVKKQTTDDGREFARIVKVKFSSLSSKLKYMKKFRDSKPDDPFYSGTCSERQTLCSTIA